MKQLFKLSFIALTFSLLLGACNTKPETHQHTYSDEWNYNEEYHWHDATCEHSDEVSDKAEHTFVKGETVAPTVEERGYTIYTCSVCSYSVHKDFVDPVDPYNGRIREKMFKVLNISNERQSSSDPRYYDENTKPLSEYEKPDSYKFYYLDQVDEVYYLPLSTFVNLYKGDFKDGVENTIVESNGVTTWTAKLGEKTYSLSLDKTKKTMTVLGSLEEFFKEVPNGRFGVYDQTDMKVTYPEGHEEKAKVFSFEKYGFDIFEVDGTTCYPFSLIAVELSKYVERKFINVSNDNYLIEYAVGAQFDELVYRDKDGKEVLFTDLINKSFMTLYGKNKVFPDGGEKMMVFMPTSLAEFNKKLIYFLFDNYYGLASTRGIKSMSDYFNNLEVSSKYFTDTDGGNRGSGYFYALQGLNDLHTSYGYSSYMSEYPVSEIAINDQSTMGDRTDLRAYLSAMREVELDKYNEANSTNVTYKEVRYSKDGKNAYFSFDEFDTYHYYESGEVPESELLYDTYHRFVKNLNEIKAKNTVERVMIDDSLNGGGYVAIMGKLLALLSKDNKSTMYLRDQGDDSIQEITTRVDSNKDGIYDEKDCFGNDFKFYVITSNFSFSCGNAFPFYADRYEYAKIIGTRSGGGECCVFNFVLPTGQSITYSSPFHIGYYSKTTNTFKGDEDGAYPWIVPNKSINIYDVDSLGAFIDLRESHS